MQPSRHLLVALGFGLVWLGRDPAFAKNWFVAIGGSGDGSAATPYGNIQAGMNAAQSGDRVLVGEGTYTGAGNTNLLVPNRSMTIVCNAGTPGNCVIDCQNQSGVRGIKFASDGGQSSTIQGFTIRQGNFGTAPFNEGGGGILVSSASPRIVGNIIEDCVVSGAHGGGIQTILSGAPVITDNTIRRNRSNGKFGGGIAAESTGVVTIRGNQILDNDAENAAGIYARGSVRIQNCTVEDNVAAVSGGGIYVDSNGVLITDCTIARNTAQGNGGGVFISSARGTTLTKCLIAGNTSTTYGGGVGGDSGAVPVIVNCVISNNVANDAGGGVYLLNDQHSSAPKMSNTLFAYNVVISDAVEGLGGGLYAGNINPLVIHNCTFAYNKYAGATTNQFRGGGGMTFDSTKVTITNTHAWGNENTGGESGSQMFIKGDGTEATVRYSNFQFGQNRVKTSGSPTLNWDVGSNLPPGSAPTFEDRDGLDDQENTWADNDFRLKLNSPGNDAGNNLDIAQDWADLDGDTILTEPVPFAINGGRRGDDPAAADAGAPAGGFPFVDMGPYERCTYQIGVVGDANSLPSNRFLAMSVPIADPLQAPTELLAIRVTLVDLQTPNPPNLPANPPTDFSAFESATCNAAGESNSCTRWVGPPSTFLESQDTPGAGSFRAARLQCTPKYHNWGNEGVFYVTGAEIVPSSVYRVDTFASVCTGIEETCQNLSCPIEMRTARWGDVADYFRPPSTTTQPDAIDIAQLVSKFGSLPGAIPKVRAQVQPNLPELTTDVGAIDIVLANDAFKGFAYPLSGPCICPSAVPCGVIACGSASQCTTYGSGATCVRTCVGAPNAGQICTGPKDCNICELGTFHGLPCDPNLTAGLNPCNVAGGTCPFTGVCGAVSDNPGFCRDRCGRCQ